MRVPLILAVILVAVSILIDLYITYDIRKSTRRNGWWIAYASSSVACWLFLIVVLCLPKRSEEGSILPIMWMLYTYLSVYAAKFLYLLGSVSGRILRAFVKPPFKAHPAKWFSFAAALGLFAAMWIGVVKTRRTIEVNRVEVASPRLPSSFNGYKIAQISDLHVGTWGFDPSFLRMLVDSVNSLHPDLIVFTGDLVNRKTDELLPFVDVLSQFKAKDGVLSVLGNHDYGDYVDWKSPEDKVRNNRLLAGLQAKMGWRLLNNEKVFIARGVDSILLAGVENWGDPPFHTYADFEKALSSSRDSVYHQNDTRFKVLLTHNPEHWNRVVSETTNIDLTLSGHTHAMQIMARVGNWKWSPAVFRYPLWGGLYRRPNKWGHETSLYVNIGAGEVGLPSRLFSAYPEITLFTLEKEGF